MALGVATPGGKTPPLRLEVRGVKKAFGPTLALSGVDLEVRAGEVHAVIGQNGAGKSTLMAILGGSTPRDEGSIALDGAPFFPTSPRDARDLGIAIVHQELSLCAHLTVADNILLGVEPSRFGLLDKAAIRTRVEAVLRTVFGPVPGEGGGVPVRPDTRISDLGPADRQKVEIARALAQTERGCRVLILDEPTSSLAKDDVERLFALVEKLKAADVSVVYISHFLEEIARIADRFTVLRDGRTVGHGNARAVPATEIVTMMAGRAVEQLFPRSPRARGEVVLAAKDVSGREKPERASFELRRGEVLGLAGLIGAGRTELLRTIFGLDELREGTVTLAAYSGKASPRERLDHGAGMLSEDRKKEGLALGLTIADNITLSKLPPIVLGKEETASAQKIIDTLAIRAQGPNERVGSLSGGNQQKVALGRLLHHDVDVFLLDEPTRGIDVASKAQIYALIDGLAARGKAVLVVSSQLPELLGLCDRIAVMRRGRLGEAKDVTEWTEEKLLQEAAGVPT